jgi:uncharacterized protein (DUF2062 family)
MFKTAQKASLRRRITGFFWPRRGFRRAWTFLLLRLSRLKSCPHRISIGFAAGAFASFLPLVGFHFLIAAALAVILRGSLIASAIGTVVGNPITFPLIWFATYKLGTLLTGQPSLHSPGDVAPLAELHGSFSMDSISAFWQALGSALWPMFVGAMPLGLLCASACYALVYFSIRGLRRRSPSANIVQV